MRPLGIGLIIGALAIALFGVIFWVWQGSRSVSTPVQGGTLPTEDGQTTIPTTTGTTTTASANTLSLAASSGTVVIVQNFLQNPNTVADTSNQGYYYLGYHLPMGPDDTTADISAPYVIEYIAAANYFNISLLQEPIGEARQEAEQYLLSNLGISESQACSLKYMVSVPDKVNSFYSGESLGFSFCANAVQLP
jgi:hypothetical protein